jgi:6-phosphogluconate dehydrogenase
MESMSELVDRLRVQRNEHASAMERIDQAIKLLSQNGSGGASQRFGQNGMRAGVPPRRTMSAAARRKISLAMKKRHAAKRIATSKSQNRASRKLHWTQTPEGKRKFAAIRAKAHRKAA